MSKQLESFIRKLSLHLTTLLLMALALALGLRGQIVPMICTLVIAVVAYFCVRQLLLRIGRAEEQKYHLDQQLVQSQKLAAIGELSSGIAHEINNPLAIIGQEIEWVRHLLKESDFSAGDKMADLNDSLQEIARQVERCRDITHKLLGFARKQEPLLQSVDINRLIEDMAKLVEKEATHHKIQIVRDYQQDLPSVHTDAPLLRQVILNFLNNACYAIGRDGLITITTRTSGGDGVDILVRDSGCGIPKENLGKIFDPFFTTKPPGKGTGLGLSICHGIIKKLGGDIRVASETGKGTLFTIHLPGTDGKGEI